MVETQVWSQNLSRDIEIISKVVKSASVVGPATVGGAKKTDDSSVANGWYHFIVS